MGGGTKRRRGSKATKNDPGVPVAESSTIPNYVYQICQHFQSSKRHQPTDRHWSLVACAVLQRLLTERANTTRQATSESIDKTNLSRMDAVVVMAKLCDVLSEWLVGQDDTNTKNGSNNNNNDGHGDSGGDIDNEARLDKLAKITTGSALLVTTVGATVCLQDLVEANNDSMSLSQEATTVIVEGTKGKKRKKKADPQEESNFYSGVAHDAIIQQTTRTLDRLVHWHQVAPHDEETQAQHQYIGELESACLKISTNAIESKAVRGLLEVDSTYIADVATVHTSSSNTRGRTRRKTASLNNGNTSAANQKIGGKTKITNSFDEVGISSLAALEELPKLPKVADVRTPRKWNSTILVWYSPGLSHLLQTVLYLSSLYREQSKYGKIISRLLHIVVESGSIAVRSPSTSIDAAMKQIGNTFGRQRTDLRDIMVVTLYNVCRIYSMKSGIDNLHTKIPLLCKAAAMSVPQKSAIQVDWAKIMRNLAAAFILKFQLDNNDNVDHEHDALMTWTWMQVSETIRNVSEKDSVKEFVFKKKPKSQDDGFAEPQIQATAGTFAGLCKSPSSSTSWTEEDSLAIILRSIGGTGDPRSHFISILVEQVRRVYATSLESSERHKGRKRSTPSISRMSKLRKTEQGALGLDDNSLLQRIHPDKAQLVEYALACMTNTFCITGKKNLAQSFREHLSLKQIQDLLGLGTVFEEHMLQSRLNASNWNVEGEDSYGSMEAASSFTSTEYMKHQRLLWTSYMGMVEALANGNRQGMSSINQTFSETTRKAIFMFIMKSSLHEALTLSKGHRNFLLAAMTWHPNDAFGNVAEQALVKYFTKGIKETMKKLVKVPVERQEKEHRILYLRSNQIDYESARIFATAFCRISKENQRKTFEELVSVMLSVLKQIDTDLPARKAFLSSDEASCFVSRVLILCSTLMNLHEYSDFLQQMFIAEAKFFRVEPPLGASEAEECSQKKYFMSLFNDWQNPTLPVELDGATQRLSEKVLKQMRDALEISFSVGFECAPNDNCYLLYASWNGLGKLSSVPTVKSNETLSLHIIPGDYPKRILELRDDISLIQRRISVKASEIRGNASHRLRSHLKSTLHRANLLLRRLLEHCAGEEEVPISFFCLLRGLTAYNASIISAHTQAGDGFFSKALACTPLSQRQRTDSLGSEHLASEVESTETSSKDDEDDSQINAIALFRERCNAIGSAPIHPDWLDSACSFQECIRPSDAVDNAECSLRMLKQLAVTAFSNYKSNLLLGLKAMSTTENMDHHMELYTEILPFLSYKQSSDSQFEQVHPTKKWEDEICSLLGVSAADLSLLTDLENIATVDKSQGNLSRIARQRDGNVKVLPQFCSSELSLPELRAGGEWELILSQALLTASINVDTTTFANKTKAGGKNSRYFFNKAKIWYTILTSSVSHMQPASALLRMGINKTGRMPHPFSFGPHEDINECTHTDFSEELKGTGNESALVAETIQECLSFISVVSIQKGFESLTQSIANQLLVESKTFEEIVDFQQCFLGFQCLRRILTGSEGKVKTSLSNFYSFLSEHVLLVIYDRGRKDVHGERSSCFGRLLAYFGIREAQPIKTVCAAPSNAFKIVATTQARVFKLSSQVDVLQDLRLLAAAAIGNQLHMSNRGRACAAVILDAIVSGENLLRKRLTGKPLDVIDAVYFQIDQTPKWEVTEWILHDLCRLFDGKATSVFHQEAISRVVLSLLLQIERLKYKQCLFDSIFQSITEWLTSDMVFTQIEPAFEVLLVIGCYFRRLHEIASKILQVGPSLNEPLKLQMVGSFLCFAKSLKRKSDKSTIASDSTSQDGNVEMRDSSNENLPSKYRKRCSFVEKTGYHGQHWYNCYTCGLVWEKGCCSLCALVCHKGHDVSYSRYSSFFCDCAAEDGTSTSQSRSPCQCMSQLSMGTIRNVYEKEKADINISIESNTKIHENQDVCTNFSGLCVDVAYKSFSDRIQENLSMVSRVLDNKKWINALVNVLEIESTNAGHQSSHINQVSTVVEKFMEDSRSHRGRRAHAWHLSASLIQRIAKPLEVSQMDIAPMVPVRNVLGCDSNFSSDISINAHLTERLSRSNICRQNVVADSRGRIIVAEASCLTFYCPVQAVVRDHVDKKANFSRQEICMLGFESVPFIVVGIELSFTNERHILIWGLSEACFAILNPTWDGIEQRIDLSLDLAQDDDRNNFLVKCGFIPGTGVKCVVGCRSSIRVFDVSINRKRCKAALTFNFTFETSLRDFALVPVSDTGAGNVTTPKKILANLFLLLENGHLHAINLFMNVVDGTIGSSDLENNFLNLNETISISMEGIRSRESSLIGARGSKSKSLGEGSTIFYLKCSRMLLYQCTTSCVVALKLNDEGNVIGTFEILPNFISSEMPSFGTNGDSITGPFVHWTELGICHSKDGAVFRLACVGKSSRTNQSKLLCVDFNSKVTRVKGIAHTNFDVRDIVTSDFSITGMSSFSLPFVGKTLGGEDAFGERSFLCGSTSFGSLFFFGEDCIDTVNDLGENFSMIRLSSLSTQRSTNPVFPLTIYESMRNVSDSDELFISGFEIGCEISGTRWKLLRECNAPFDAHDGEARTLSFSLRSKHQDASSLGEQSTASLGRTHGIVALRVLVGSTPSMVPVHIFVQGRRFDLEPNKKKWYSFPLTNEEIALGIRTGVVSLTFDKAFDSLENSRIDSVELYAKNKKELCHWIPKKYYFNSKNKNMIIHRLSAEENAAAERSEHQSEPTDCLLQVSQAIKALCELCPNTYQHLIGKHSRLLQNLVENYAFTANMARSKAILEAVFALQPSEKLRGSAYDESYLRGWMHTILQIKISFDDLTGGIDEQSKWGALSRIFVECLKALCSVAQDRPVSYLQSMGAIFKEEKRMKSAVREIVVMTVKASVRSLPCVDIVCGPTGLVALCLTEIAIELNTESDHILGSFNDLKALLRSNNMELVSSTCSAISDFCDNFQNEEYQQAGLFNLLHGARLVAYQCDSCGLCPLKDVRYTCLEESFDIDLCKTCYDIAKGFASKNDYSDAMVVTIDGRTVGSNSKLSCAQISQMEAVTLERMDLEQVEVRGAQETGSELQKAIRLSMGETVSEPSSDDYGDVQVYEDFVSHTFQNVLEVLASCLQASRDVKQVADIMRLCICIIRNSTSSKARQDRSILFIQNMAQIISMKLKGLEAECSSRKALLLGSCIKAVYFLLFTSDADAVAHLAALHSDDASKSKTYPDVLCDEHKLPAVRRRSAKGKNKDRRFYHCGKERGQRCNFFKWADEVQNLSKDKPRVNSELLRIVLERLWRQKAEDGTLLNQSMCKYLEKCLLKLNSQSSYASSTESDILDFGYSKYDIDDGVLCSREKLNGTTIYSSLATDTMESLSSSELANLGSGKDNRLLQSILDLLSIVGPKESECNARWFSLLCKIDLQSKSTSLQGYAQKILKSLCKEKVSLYQSVRNHFFFIFQLQKFYRDVAPLLKAAFLVHEKARMCKSHDTTTNVSTWFNFHFGGLIGSDKLISRGEYPEEILRIIERSLETLWNTVKTDVGSWRRFCGLSSLPDYVDFEDEATPDSFFAEKMSKLPPIAVMFWVLCALPPCYQGKVLQLIVYALSAGKERKPVHNMEQHDDSHIQNDVLLKSLGSVESVLPENLLLSENQGFSVDAMVSFVFHFVYDGESMEIRKGGLLLISRLIDKFPNEELSALLKRLMSTKFLDIGPSGRASNEYLNLLQILTGKMNAAYCLTGIGHTVLHAFILQIDAIKHGRANKKWVSIELPHGTNLPARKKFDISGCIYCIKTSRAQSLTDSVKHNEPPNTTSSSLRSATTQHQKKTRGVRSPTPTGKKLHFDQCAPFSRIRIEGLKSASTSNEFNTFFVLRHRVVLSDIHFIVNDPRGRYVKTATIFYLPHPTKDTAKLKADEFLPKWQKCASISIPRGSLRASAVLEHPVVACNLRIEYTEFHERPGDTKASDGSILVHCPRCTRVVTNAHGVCGHCGEVAFQCRKCRHINYDRLDAFLCVECGYCASGSFSLELNAAVASNAIIITSDEEYQSSTKLLGATKLLRDEVKLALVGALERVEEKISKKTNSAFNMEIEMAFERRPPQIDSNKEISHGVILQKLDKEGSVVRLAARPEALINQGRSQSTSDRTRSLLRLARQIRSDSSSTWDRRQSGNVMIRHLSRGSMVDGGVDDEAELVGLLESGNNVSSSASLGQAIADARTRRDTPNFHSRLFGTTKKVSIRELMTESQRLYVLLREAQLEIYELRHRLHAWEKLNEGHLVDVGFEIESNHNFSACDCSVCASSVAFHLLQLWLCLFKARPQEVVADADLINFLLSESAVVGRNLSEAMRDAVKEVAIGSEQGAMLVLAQLRKRLSSTNDPVSAEILGKIMTVKNHFFAEEFSKFAIEVLMNQQL